MEKVEIMVRLEIKVVKSIKKINIRRKVGGIGLDQAVARVQKTITVEKNIVAEKKEDQEVDHLPIGIGIMIPNR